MLLAMEGFSATQRIRIPGARPLLADGVRACDVKVLVARVWLTEKAKDGLLVVRQCWCCAAGRRLTYLGDRKRLEGPCAYRLSASVKPLSMRESPNCVSRAPPDRRDTGAGGGLNGATLRSPWSDKHERGDFWSSAALQDLRYLIRKMNRAVAVIMVVEKRKDLLGGRRRFNRHFMSN